MKFFDYLESAYAIKNIEVQETYTAFGHAETQALSDLTNGQRKFFKFVAYFKVLFNYLMIQFGFKPALKEAKEVIKEVQEKKLAEHKARKAEADKLAQTAEPVLN